MSMKALLSDEYHTASLHAHHALRCALQHLMLCADRTSLCPMLSATVKHLTNGGGMRRADLSLKQVRCGP